MNRTILVVIASAAAATAAAQERLQIVAPDGAVVATVDGDASSVALDASVDTVLRRPDSHLRLIHNHPNSRGLSGADLEQLTKPGVEAIEAVGADGSRYEASRGPAFDARRLLGWQYRVAEAAVIRHLGDARGGSVHGADIDAHIAHVIAVALEKAQVIRYRSSLARPRAASYERYRVLLGHAAELAAARARGGP